MTAGLSELASQWKSLRWSISTDAAHARRPVVILLHGLGGDRNDWMSPFLERNWPYDHRRDPDAMDLGVHSSPPIAKLPGIDTKLFLSPRLASNSRGRDGSDDRSWWHALVSAGFPVITYSQTSGLMLPLTKGPVAEFKSLMAGLQQKVLTEASLRSRQVVILGHSRGGLIARAYLGDPQVKADSTGQFPRVSGLITISTPHQGSHAALLDDRIIEFLEKLQSRIPNLPSNVGNQVIETLKAKVDAYVGPYGDEIEPDSTLFRTLEAQEPIRPGVRCISVGGTSPRFLRIYLWAFTPDSLIPRKGSSGKLEFHWKAAPVEAKIASPIPDGLPLKLFGLELDELVPGRGDGLTADKRCRFPASFREEEHLSFPLSHAEELWDRELMRRVIDRLDTFQ